MSTQENMGIDTAESATAPETAPVADTGAADRDEFQAAIDSAAAQLSGQGVKLPVETLADAAEEPDTRTAEEKADDERITQHIKNFDVPKKFSFVVSNVLMGTYTKFVRACDFPATDDVPHSPEQTKAFQTAEEFYTRFGCEYAVLFAATNITLREIDLGDWEPLPVPDMEGEAKLLLVHKDTWKIVSSHSIVLRHHPSLLNRRHRVQPDQRQRPTLSEAYEIYAFREEGAFLEYISRVPCTRCRNKPAPLTCQSCAAPYCTPACLTADRAVHEDACLASIMKSMALTVAQKRTEFNNKKSEIRAEQEKFRERNRGKLVPVYRMDKDGKWLVSEEVVEP